jgi:hypothetical protein
MIRQALVLFLSVVPFAACFDESVDPGAADGLLGRLLSSNSTAPPPSGQCATGSAECFALCGSPSCADLDGLLPPNLGTPVIYQADGSTTTNPCAQIEQESMTIRERSCAPCHTSSVSGTALTFILTDSKLVTSPGPLLNDSGKPEPFVVPGDPADSIIYKFVVTGQMPPANPSDIIGQTAAATLVTPSQADISVLYSWILNCVPGTDGGAYGASYYGGNYGPAGSAAGAPSSGSPDDDSDAGNSLASSGSSGTGTSPGSSAGSSAGSAGGSSGNTGGFFGSGISSGSSRS